MATFSQKLSQAMKGNKNAAKNGTSKFAITSNYEAPSKANKFMPAQTKFDTQQDIGKMQDAMSTARKTATSYPVTSTSAGLGRGNVNPANVSAPTPKSTMAEAKSKVQATGTAMVSKAREVGKSVSTAASTRGTSLMDKVKSGIKSAGRSIDSFNDKAIVKRDALISKYGNAKIQSAVNTINSPAEKVRQAAKKRLK